MELTVQSDSTPGQSATTPVQGAGMPLRDFGSFVHTPTISDKEIKDHRSQDTVYVGLHLPRQRRPHRRERRKHHRKVQQPTQDVSMTEDEDDVEDVRPNTGLQPNAGMRMIRSEGDFTTPPSQHVQFLLGEEEEDDEHKTHDLFCELGELFTSNGEMEWKETARWIKFEEDVEEGGERWSKPHVATLSLHSLFELRSCLNNGTVVLDLEGYSFEQIVDIMLDLLVANNQLEIMLKDQVRDVLLQRHRHLNEKHEKRHHDNSSSKIHLPIIRSLADIGRKYSLPKEMHHHQHEPDPAGMCQLDTGKADGKDRLTAVKTMPNFNHMQSASSSPNIEGGNLSVGHLKRNQSSGNDLHETASSAKLNMPHFMKKIPPGAEAANVLVGEVDFLTHQVVAFLRLKSSMVIGDLTEVPVPTKFMFVMLGPLGNQSKYHEIGRAIATLMTDEIFHDVAYHAHNRDDLLAGIDEFLDQVTVLPPGEWDPSIRIEPPKSVPSQEGRKTGDAQQPLPNGKTPVDDEEDGGAHGDDPALQMTGRLFGGLRQDIMRKKPFYISDFRDALHVQSLASFMFLYFACLTPIITFGGLLADATEKDLGAFESLLAGAIVGILYALFSGQPLTILGSTGPVLVFETILYTFCKDQGWYYLSFRWWVGMWTGIILLLMVAFDLSALVRYITRFTEESFAALISLIFIKEAIGKVIDITEDAPVNTNPNVSPFHECICLAPIVNDTAGDTNATNSNTTTIVNVVLLNASSTVGVVTSTVSSILSPNVSNVNVTSLEEAVMEKEWHKIPMKDCVAHGGRLAGQGCDHVADVFFLSVLLFIATFVIAYSLKGMRNGKFFPSKVRTIISDFAVVISIASMVGLDAIIGLNTPKLEVPDKFHPTNHENRGWLIPPFHEKNPVWLCVVALIPALLATILLFMDQQITAVIVNRKENKLKKGCGYHLDLLLVAVLIMINSALGLPYFVAATVLSITHVMSLKKESTCTAPGERPAFLGVREQRVTATAIFFMIGLSVFLTSILKFIPMAVLYGVFLYMGISSLKGMQLVNRIMIWFMPMKYQPDYTYLRHVRTRRVHFFTFIQVMCLIMLWVIKTIKSISIAFPIMVLAMCFIRKGLDWVFTQTELKWLDDIMPEVKRREKDDKDREKQTQQQEEEYETLLDPKCASGNPDFCPKSSMVNVAINGGHDSFISQVNISEEMSKCAIWKNLQNSVDPNTSSHHSLKEDRDISKRKHKKRHKNGNHSHLPTIPSSPTGKEEKGSRKGGSVAFYIDEEDSDKDDTMHAPQIIIDPPSDSNLNQLTHRKGSL